MPKVFEDALAAIGAAISDVREKAVEEAYFGRLVSGGQDAPEMPASSPQAGGAFDQALGSKLQQIDISPSKSQEAPEPGSGMDR